MMRSHAHGSIVRFVAPWCERFAGRLPSDRATSYPWGVLRVEGVVVWSTGSVVATSANAASAAALAHFDRQEGLPVFPC